MERGDESEPAPRGDIRRVKSLANVNEESTIGSQEHNNANKSAVLEVAKYMSKATQLLEIGDELPEFHRQMARVRLYGVSKALRKYIKQGDITAAELLDGDDAEIDARTPDARAVARWFEDSAQYLITDLA